MFEIFVDFLKAFDSINHNLLWCTLNNQGMSTKIIRLLRQLYENSSATVRSKRNYTEEIEVMRVVLQGEVLSPFPFSLFNADLDVFFRAHGVNGIPVTSSPDLLSPLYADDLMLLADAISDAKNKLKILHNYCRSRELEVNISKTKVLLFYRGKSKNTGKFYYSSSEIERVSECTYLGVSFFESGVFSRAAKFFEAKTKQAIGAGIGVCAKSKLVSMSSRDRVYEALAQIILLYAVPVWGLRYLPSLQVADMHFYKRTLSLNRNTPFWAIRLELNQLHSSYTILKRTLDFPNVPSWLLLRHVTKTHPASIID